MELPQKVQANVPQDKGVLVGRPPSNIKIIYSASVILGLIVGTLLGSLYQGRLLTTYIYSPAISKFFATDKIDYPNIGFNYVHYLRRFPTEIFENPNQVNLLSINGGAIRSIPEDVSSLQLITTLTLANNRLQELPEAIGNLTMLENVDFGGNHLKTLPSSFGNLTNLKKLYLYDNQLEEIPDEIGNLVGVEIIDLHLNNLTTLPQTLGNLQNLKVLYLGGNKFSETEQQNIRNMLPNTQIFF